MVQKYELLLIIVYICSRIIHITQKIMIKDFNFYAPTRVVFGRESEEQLPQLIQQYGGGKVLVHFGGGSARRSGLLDKVEKMLLR